MAKATVGEAGAAAGVAASPGPSATDAKRLGFLKAMEWQTLHQLMVDAKILVYGDSGSGGCGGGVRVDAERLAAMLSLTAIHDVMKLEHLCPRVTSEHAPFHGHAEGEAIRDHDLALGCACDAATHSPTYLPIQPPFPQSPLPLLHCSGTCASCFQCGSRHPFFRCGRADVLLHDPAALPCYASMPPAQQASVRFTQADLGFNHGWLVQAEAPPGALFGQFKALLSKGAVASQDVCRPTS